MLHVEQQHGADLHGPRRTRRFVVFGDAGWAGELVGLRPDAVLASAGAGVTFFDGAFRIDVARALVKSSRLALELSLDALL